MPEAPPSDPIPEHGRTPPLQLSNAALRALASFENALVTVLLVATVAVIAAQVLFRYAVDSPLSWSTEIATDLLVYVAFVGFAIGVRDNAHVALQLFESRLGPRGRTVLRTFELVVLGAVLVAVGTGGALYAWEHRDTTSPIDLPVWVPFLALPLGGLLGTVHVVVELVAIGRRGFGPVTRDPGSLTEAVA